MKLANTVPVINHIRPGQFSRIVFRPDDDGGAGSGGDGGNSGGDSGGDDDPLNRKVDMTQKELNDLIDKKYKDGATKTEKRLNDELTKLRKLVEESSKKPEGKKPDGDSYSKEDVQKLLSDKEGEFTTKEEGYLKRISSLQAASKNAAIVDAAVKAKALNPAVLTKLVSDSIEMDEDGNLTVVGPDGKGRINGKGKDMTVLEFVEEFLTENAYLRAGSGNNGTGSSNANGKKVDDSKLTPQQKLAAALRSGTKKG